MKTLSLQEKITYIREIYKQCQAGTIKKTPGKLVVFNRDEFVAEAAKVVAEYKKEIGV